jgi:hypothetical protein
MESRCVVIHSVFRNIQMNTRICCRSIKRIIAMATIATFTACSGESNDQSTGASGTGGSSNQSGTGGGASGAGVQLTGLDREAHDFMAAKIDQHWLKTADGWTTQYEKLNLAGEVMPGQPDALYWQLRNISFSVHPRTVSESQRLNGSDYRGEVSFASTSTRNFNLKDVGLGPVGWAPWEDYVIGTIAIERRNGKWITSETDLFTWIKPKADELAAAK